MSELPRVVALLPAYNSEDFIGATLDSLAAQTYPNLEILIGDDASDDGTAELCEAFAEDDPRFRVVRRQQRLGWLGNTNALISEVSGDFAFLMGDDDQVAANYVERLAEVLLRNPEAVLSFTDLEVIGVDGVSSRAAYVALDGVADPFKRAEKLVRWGRLEAVPGPGLVRITAMAKLAGLRRHLGGEVGADRDWLLRLSQEGGFVRVPELMYRKVVRAESVSQWQHPIFGHVCLGLSMIGSVLRMRLSRVQKARLCLGLLRSISYTFVRDWAYALVRPVRDWYFRRRRHAN